ncbi:MAG: hypothetical protein AAB769_01350 [Patescibacteria group bacterium]
MHRLHKHMPSRAAKNRITNIAGVFFLLVATLHLARAIAGWEATIAGWTIPIWFSWVATLVAILLARAMFQMDKE